MSENGLHKIPVMKSALEQIQETHTGELLGFSEVHGPMRVCVECDQKWPCPTRKLADAGLATGGEERG